MSSNKPILCYVTDRLTLAVSGAGDPTAALVTRIRCAGAAGIDWVELREKDLEGGALAKLAGDAVIALRENSVDRRKDSLRQSRLLVNDRLDVAITAGAGGVHLGENSLPVSAVAQCRGQAGAADFLVGASCHSLESARRSARDGADYVIFGPVFATPSKAAFGAPQGLGKLEEICHAVSIPVLAIGGISKENARQCLQAGAAGIAAIRLFQDARDVAEVVGDLRKMLEV